MARAGEINHLIWEDVDFENRTVTLFTRKKKGGHRRGRRIAMTRRLHSVLRDRWQRRDADKPWVFWHEFVSSKTGQRMAGPFLDRKKFMRTLCRRAEVPYFRFHALRHGGATLMNAAGVPIGVIQAILGHENRSTTEIYLHRVSDAEQQAMATFEAARKKSHIESHIGDEERGNRRAVEAA